MPVKQHKLPILFPFGPELSMTWVKHHFIHTFFPTASSFYNNSRVYVWVEEGGSLLDICGCLNAALVQGSNRLIGI